MNHQPGDIVWIKTIQGWYEARLNSQTVWDPEWWYITWTHSGEQSQAVYRETEIRTPEQHAAHLLTQ